MNYTQLFNNNLTIFDGTKKTLVFKGDFTCKIESLVFDLTGEAQSSVFIYNEKNVIINIGDIVKFDLDNKILIGKIRDFKKNEDNEMINILTLVLNGDVIDYDFPANGNKYTFNNLVFNDYNPINMLVNINEVATTTQPTISLSTALRQVRRKVYLNEKVDIIDNEVFIYYTYGNNEYVGLSEYDVDLTNKVVEFASDSYNLLYLYNQDNLTQFSVYYLRPDGEVVNLGQAQFSFELPEAIGTPYIPRTELVEATNYNSLNFAKSKMKDQEYNNLIEFTIPRNHKFDFINLGQKVEFWTKNGNTIKSIISFLEIKEDVINVKLGITRTKFSDQKRKDKV